MVPRIDYYNIGEEVVNHMMELEAYTKKSGISRTTRELVKIRASQINGCAYCIDMHTTDARKMGETEQRIYGLNAWDDCTFYTEAEKVALELTEHVTLISTKRVPDELYNRVREHYDEKEYFDLIVIINQINSWNRLSIAMGNMATEQE